MLVSDVVNSKSIALAATENASNQIPYLGLQWFPEEKKQGLDLKWIKTYKGLTPSLAPSEFDTLPVIRARGGLDEVNTKMAFFRESMLISEEDQNEIDRIQSESDPYLASALQSIYDDTNTLLTAAELVPERMRMQLLSTAQIGISANGVNYAYNYDPNGTWAATNKVTLSNNQWNDTTNAKPLTDLNNARKALAKKGKIVSYVLMNSNTFQYLINNAQVRSAILAQNATANIFITDDLVKAIVKNTTQLTVVLYDKMCINDSGSEVNLYPDDVVTLLPAGPVGKTWFGTTPEERTARQVADVDVTIYGKGIAIATKTVYGPPAETSTIASEVVLPSFEGMESVLIMTVHTAG